MRPRLSRRQPVHFLEERARVPVDRAEVRPDEREELWPDEWAQVGVAASRRQKAKTRFRITLYHPIGGFCRGP
jgi:hypothetical protein